MSNMGNTELRGGNGVTGGKGITAVIGIILLVAVAVILIVIIATFFIGFTSSSARDLSKSAPKIQVLSGSQCIANDGLLTVTNDLTEDVPVATNVEVRQGTAFYAFGRTTIRSISAGTSSQVGLEYNQGDNPPFAFKDGKEFTITMVEGPAKGQSFIVQCANVGDFFSISIDTTTGTQRIKTTQEINVETVAEQADGDCATDSDVWDLYKGLTKVNADGDDKTICVQTDDDANVPADTVEGTDVNFQICDNSDDTCVDIVFETGSDYTFVLTTSAGGDSTVLQDKVNRVTAQ